MSGTADMHQSAAYPLMLNNLLVEAHMYKSHDEGQAELFRHKIKPAYLCKKIEDIIL